MFWESGPWNKCSSFSSGQLTSGHSRTATTLQFTQPHSSSPSGRCKSRQVIPLVCQVAKHSTHALPPLRAPIQSLKEMQNFIQCIRVQSRSSSSLVTYVNLWYLLLMRLYEDLVHVIYLIMECLYFIAWSNTDLIKYIKWPPKYRKYHVVNRTICSCT